MFSIRPFEENDDAAMLEIEKLCPQGNDKLAMGVDKSPNSIARYKLYDNWNVLVAEEEGKVAGWVGWTAKNHPTRKEQYIYLTEVMVNPEFQRKGIATKLVAEVDKNAQETGSDHVYCYIYETNDASKSLFGNLGYSAIRDIKICAVSVYKKIPVEQKFKIEHIDKNDIPEVVSLINDFYSGYAHFVPFTPDDFESHLNGITGYGSENFWVVKDEGNIVACAGLWDSSILAELYYTKEPLMWKVMDRIFAFFSLFGKMPNIPAEGEHFKVHYVTDCAFNPNNPDAMLNLIRHFNNILFDTKRDWFAALLDPDDPLFEIINKFRPQIDLWSVFAKPFERELPEFTPFYTDIRDMIP